MSASEAAAEALRWLRFSKEDLEAAGHFVAGDHPTPRHACWLSQQAAEKALKAALVLEGIDIPFIHDLRVLRNLLPDGWPAGPAQAAMAQLTVWGAESRYPGDWPEPTAADAARAVAEARTVYDYVAAELVRRRLIVE